MNYDERINLRLPAPVKKRWVKQAKRRSFVEHGQPNISGWIRHLAEEDIKTAKAASRK